MKGKVLILSSSEDPHAASVAAHLESLGTHFDYFRFEDVARARLELQFGRAVTQTKNVITIDGTNLDLHSYHSIWHRRPGQIETAVFAEPWITSMVRSETKTALDGLLRLSTALWVNHPLDDIACMNKLWQLRVAESIGLHVPETLISNDAATVREFYKLCDGRVIYKLISEQSNFAIPVHETPSGIPTLTLREEDLEHIVQVRHAPHFFQRAIAKSFELRATIVGKKIFCIRIDSQVGDGKTDWRNDYTVPMEGFELPREIELRLFKLLEILKLNYGAVDLIYTPAHEFVFIEVNCAGQFLWAEQRCDLPISLELANLLSGRSSPLVPLQTL